MQQTHFAPHGANQQRRQPFFMESISEPNYRAPPVGGACKIPHNTRHLPFKLPFIDFLEMHK